MLDVDDEPDWAIPEVRRLVDFGLLDQAPRAVLDGVTAQAFPLIADRRRLQYFLDRHFNDTFTSCKVRLDLVSPVVLFTTLFYPRMHGFDRAEASILEQDEYYFLIPVRLRRWSGGRETEEIGVVTPYIYVSNAVSTPLGRELFGWQKSMYKLKAVVPRGARMGRTEPYLEVEQPVPGRHGQELEYRRVLAVLHRNDAAPAAFGGELSHTLELIEDMPRVATIAARAFLSEFGAALPGLSLVEQAKAAIGLLRDVLHPNEELNVYSMLQFPHPSIGIMGPDGMPQFAAAFQALMKTKLRVRNMRSIGLLGTASAGVLDPSRGFSLRIAGHGVDQVVTRLGLQVWECDREDGEDHDVQVVHPFFPSSARFDLEVSGLETIARRTATSDWTDGTGAVIGRSTPGMVARFNTFLGPSSADGLSSYGRVYQEQAYRIIAVRAPLATLSRLCREIAPTPEEIQITPRAIDEDDGLIVVVITRLPPAHGPIERLEWFSGAYLNIAVVADIAMSGASRPIFLETHGFTDNPHAFVVGRELLAANRWLMEVDDSPQTWLPDTSRAADGIDGRHMLRVRADALRALNAGDRVVMSPLIDIVECDGEGAHHEGEFATREALRPHIDEVFREQRFTYLRMDTLRTVDPNGVLRASLLRCNVEEVYFSRPGVEADHPTWLGPHELYIYPYASMPLVRQLGLAAEAAAKAPFSAEGAPDPQRLMCPLALGGRLPAARRSVMTLFECDENGWRSNMLDEFFFGVEEENAVS